MMSEPILLNASRIAPVGYRSRDMGRDRFANADTGCSSEIRVDGSKVVLSSAIDSVCDKRGAGSAEEEGHLDHAGKDLYLFFGGNGVHVAAILTAIEGLCGS